MRGGWEVLLEGEARGGALVEVEHEHSQSPRSSHSGQKEQLPAGYLRTEKLIIIKVQGLVHHSEFFGSN